VRRLCAASPLGGDLVLPDFRLRLQYRPGDLCLFRSAVIEHAVAPFHGERTAIVMFTHEDDLKLGKATMDPKIQEALDKLGKEEPIEDVPGEDEDYVLNYQYEL
jgi:predicted 2-oxoglutarate/Fe(II)-dependent dioxygenase YbiX